MLDRLTGRLYRRLGRHYRFVFPLFQDPMSVGIAALTVVLVSSYYDASSGELAAMIAAGMVSTLVAIGFAFWRGQPHLERVHAWQESEHPSEKESALAWDAATNFPIRSFRANAVFVSLIAALPTVALIVVLLDLQWYAGVVLLAAAAVPSAYATLVNYFIAEYLMRPAIEDIAAHLPEDFDFTANGLLIRRRLKLVLPVFTAFVGLVVASLLTGHAGTGGLALSLAAAVGVGIAVSLELMVLLSRSVTGPIAALRSGVTRVREGDYEARVPVIASDELGELSHDFNLMTLGLEERDRMRETFGTYLDRDIAGIILSGRFPREGVEITVSIMFVDVRGFTSFAERSDATEVVAALNALFEVMVPIVAEHGGHGDKFLGDGLLAVFGAPEGYRDHADRAVAAGLELARAINRPGAELRIGVGVNTGPVVAGSIGGAGRLNFSVIGDAVNLAARVEAATRDTGDDVLITRATHDALTGPVAAVSRGSVALKGKEEPVEVLACPVAGADLGRPPERRAGGSAPTRS